MASGFSRNGCQTAVVESLRSPSPGQVRSRVPVHDASLPTRPSSSSRPGRWPFERLRELMTQGRLNEKMLPPPVTPEAALAELTIAPLEIAEIRVPDVEIVSRPPAAAAAAVKGAVSMKTRFAAGIALIAALLVPPLVAQEPVPPSPPQAGPVTAAAGKRLRRFH